MSRSAASNYKNKWEGITPDLTSLRNKFMLKFESVRNKHSVEKTRHSLNRPLKHHDVPCMTTEIKSHMCTRKAKNAKKTSHEEASKAAQAGSDTNYTKTIWSR